MPAPDLDPAHRPPKEIAPTNSYQPADPVWIFRGGAWRPGVIMSASSRAATVTYRPNAADGTGVDTLIAPDIAPRAESDPVLDNPARPIHRQSVIIALRRI